MFGDWGPWEPISIWSSGFWYFPLGKQMYLKRHNEMSTQRTIPIIRPTKPATGKPATSSMLSESVAR